MRKPVVLSGMQPTGRLHIGNYLGALKNFVELQNSKKYQCYFFLADLHSLTQSSLGPAELHQNIYELTADYLAAGLDPKKSLIYQQSRISAHSELGWVLGTVTSIGDLRRMTQFKDKSGDEKESSNSGLLTYPVLQAGDIALYGANFVPVGEDQVQHLELTREIVRRFNARFGEALVEPKPLLTPTPRVMSLKNPLKKMSKSDPASCIFLDDSPEEVRDKMKRAATDSGSEVKLDWDNKPGISNLLTIYSSLVGESVEAIENQYAGKNYSAFKSDLAEVIVEHFADFRKKKAALMKSRAKLETILKAGSKKASKQAEKKMLEVKKRTGLI
jgi:tryptophanyl-tRNA synthetase